MEGSSSGSSLATSGKRYFNPATLMEQTSTSQDVFVRPAQKEKVKKMLEKKRKKEEKSHARKIKRILQRADNASHYRGMGSDTSPQTKPPPKRFTKAQSIGGRKMILKATGKIIEVAKSNKELSGIDATMVPDASKETANKPSTLSQEERELMENLLSITDSIDVPTPSVDNSVNLRHSHQQLADFDLLPDRNDMDKDLSLEDLFS